MFELMNFNTHIIHYSEPANPFNQFFLFKIVWRWYHYMHLNTAACCPNYTLNNNKILEPFILHKQRMLCIIYKTGNAFTSVEAAPDKRCTVWRCKTCAVPVGIKTKFYFIYFMGVRSNDGIISGVC